MDETRLHQAIVRAHAADEVAIAVDERAIGRQGAPGFRTTDIIVPPFVVLVLSAYLFLAIGLLAGVAALLAGGAIVLFAVRPWARAQAAARARTLGLAELEHWRTLWRLGALTLRLRRDPATACAAPAGDWQGFARDHLLPAPASMASGDR